MADGTPVMELKNVSKRFRASGENRLFAPTFLAVEDVSLQIRAGETFGIVGESGCGKSTVARLLMCLEKPTRGEIWFRGQRMDNLPEKKRRLLRPRFQTVFQDSGSSLNPRKRVEDILREPMAYHGVVPRDELDARVDQLMSQVGLPAAMRGRYPHEFSGGQRQRVCIARALSLNPDVIVLDEPVSALDVSVQAQILNLLRDLQEELGLTFVFIGHGLGAVHYISHRIAVMYMGRVVEMGESGELFDRPAHPYTRALLDAAPVADVRLRDRPRTMLTGEAAGAGKETGCPLYHRCPRASEDCRDMGRALLPVEGWPGHFSACVRALEG